MPKDNSHYDLTDEQFAIIQKELRCWIPNYERIDETARKHSQFFDEKLRKFLNAVLWKLRTGKTTKWEELPQIYGDWRRARARFSKWKIKGRFEQLHHVLFAHPGMDVLKQCKVSFNASDDETESHNTTVEPPPALPLLFCSKENEKQQKRKPEETMNDLTNLSLFKKPYLRSPSNSSIEALLDNDEFWNSKSHTP